MKQPETVIRTTGLTKMYGGKLAVAGLNLNVQRGVVYGFLGPNGAGKTTTIRMLLGLIKPSAGSAQILGYDCQRQRQHLAPRIAAIVESPAFYPYLSGKQNLEVLAWTSNFSPKMAEIEQLLEQVGLAGNEQKPVRTYSLGMKQRLGIAAALLSNPEIVFLDEPTNGLDPAGIVEIRELLRRLCAREGRTVFLSSHLLSEVEQVCDEVAVIVAGTVKLEGRVKDLLDTEREIVLSATPLAQARAALLQAYPAFLIREEVHTQRLYVSAPSTVVPELVRVLVSAEIDIHQIGAARRSLESVFLELTHGNESEGF